MVGNYSHWMFSPLNKVLRGYLGPIINTTFIRLNKAAYLYSLAFLQLLIVPKTQPLI